MTGAPCSDRTTVASLPKTFPAIERMGLAERPVFETETRGLDPVSNRSQCACLLARSGLAEGGGIEPLTLRSPWFSGPVASHLAAPSIGTPARTRTANLRVLSAAPLPDWATGANWYARSDSNRHCRGSRPRASPLPIGLRAHGAAPRIRTETDPGLNRTLLPIEREPQDGRPEEC